MQLSPPYRREGERYFTVRLRAVETVRIEIRPHIPAHIHGAVTLIGIHLHFRSIDWDHVEVGSQPVAVRVGIAENMSLQHLVGRYCDAGDQILG